MKKITFSLAVLTAIAGATRADGASQYYDGEIFSRCTAKYISVNAIESFNYDDGAWKLVMGRQNRWGGSNCELTITTECRNDIIAAMGSQNYNDSSIEGVLSNITCSCDSESDCATGFKCDITPGYSYGYCRPIANFCTTDSQCDTAKGYVCVNKTCTQKCPVSTKPDDTGWSTAARDTSDYYNFPMIEQSTAYKCSSSGNWTGTTSYRCAAHYYGTPTSASSKCTRCPGYPGPIETSPGATKVTDCYMPKGTQYGDTTGSFTLVDDCHYRLTN